MQTKTGSTRIAGIIMVSTLSLFGGEVANKPVADVDSLNLRARLALKQARAADSAAILAEAEDAINKALEAAPQDFEARKLQIKLLLARHRYREALALARPLNQSMPDNVEGWGLVSDAAMGLGDYAEAERTAQWMLNLRSTNVGGLEHGARLRELFGDNEGARQFWESALKLSLADEEERMWIGAQLASLIRRTGRAAEAEALLRQILVSRPDYQPAIAELARVRIQQHEYADAVTILRARFQRVPRPDVQFELARALRLAGQETDAKAAFLGFEQGARAVVDLPLNYNHELVDYFTVDAPNPAEALRIAEVEIARRHDVDSLNGYAWALSASGNDVEAKKQLDKALAVGLRDASFFYRAGVIAAKLRDVPAAFRYFNDSLSVSAEFSDAEAARTALKEMTPHAS